MSVRLSRDTNEVICGRHIQKRGYKVVCMRTNGHNGKHIATAYDAAKTDGICYGCRAKVGEEHRTVYGFQGKREPCPAMDHLVECSFCCQRFGRATPFVSYTQGNDCASSIRSIRNITILCGHYGSAGYDCHAYEFVGGAPVGFENADPVCDGCIRGFVEQGALVKLPGEYPWGVA